MSLVSNGIKVRNSVSLIPCEKNVTVTQWIARKSNEGTAPYNPFEAIGLWS